MDYDAKKGDWVQIKDIILKPGERAPQVPEDTSKVPLIRLVKGMITKDATIGDTVTVTTVLGRTMTGELVGTNPRYDHSFGPPPPGFMKIGDSLRRILSDGK